MKNLWVLPDERCDDSTTDEATLIDAARRDPTTFGILYQRYLPRIYRYLRTRTTSEDDAADLTQQVFLKAFDALPSYRNQGVPFAAWLFRIARNVAIDHARRKRITLAWDLLPETLHPTTNTTPESVVLREEASQRLRVLLSQMDTGKRELLALRFAAGLTSREISAVVGKSESAVKKQLTRILQTIKEQYGEV